MSAPGIEADLTDLSGGNQQKVIVGRWFDGRVRLVLLDEPFRGVDVGARADIAAQLRERAKDIGVVVASSDPSEIVQVADRVVVVAGGDVAGELSVTDVTTEELSRLMAVERTAERRATGGIADERASLRASDGLTAPLAHWCTARRPRSTTWHGAPVSTRGADRLPVRAARRARRAASCSSRRASRDSATWDNALIIFQSVAIVAIVALGVTVSMAAGGFDLSVGANVSFVVMVTALVMIRYDLSGVAAIVAGLLAGLLVAAVNSALIVVARVPDLVATLGTLFIFQGLALIITSGKSVSVGMPIGDGNVATGQFADWYRELGNGEVLSIPVPVLFLLVIAVLTYVFLAHTRWGRAMYAIGGNAAAARLAGIPVQRYRALAYVISGVLAAIGGILLSAPPRPRRHRRRQRLPAAGGGGGADRLRRARRQPTQRPRHARRRALHRRALQRPDDVQRPVLRPGLHPGRACWCSRWC